MPVYQFCLALGRCKRLHRIEPYPPPPSAVFSLSTPPTPHPRLFHQAGDLCDQLGDTARAVEWFTRLLTKAPHDSGVLSRLGALHAK